MFIQLEETPNPATLKFLPGRPVMAEGTAYFSDPDAAGGSPLALRLFAVFGVTEVFFGADFITIAKDDDVDWAQLKPALIGVLTEHFAAQRPIMSEVQDAGQPAETLVESDADAAVVRQIQDLLDEQVRPAVAMDGGDIVFRGFEQGVVYLHLQGACAGCPSSTVTLKIGIENMLKHYIPEVTEVRAVL